MGRFVEFNTAFTECQGAFDVVINCASVEIDFGGMMRLLTHDGVAIQVGVRMGWVVGGLVIEACCQQHRVSPLEEPCQEYPACNAQCM